MPGPIAFYLLAAIILIASVMVVTQRNILHAGLSLILCFWAVAGVYLILDAPFLAVVQVLIYVGAISVLLLFAIMLTHRISSLEGRGSTRALWSVLFTGSFVGLSIAMILRTPSMNVAVPAGSVPGIIELAEGFLDPNKSLLPFEMVGILLLVALVGAVIIARKDEKMETPKTLTMVVQPTGADGTPAATVSTLEGTKNSMNPFSQISLTHFLVLGTLLFGVGLYGVLARKNAVGILLSLELMFNAVNINLVAMNRYLTPGGEATGQIFAAFIVAVAAAEATLGVAIVLSIYRNFNHINIDEIDLLKW